MSAVKYKMIKFKMIIPLLHELSDIHCIWSRIDNNYFSKILSNIVAVFENDDLTKEDSNLLLGFAKILHEALYNKKESGNKPLRSSFQQNYINLQLLLSSTTTTNGSTSYDMINIEINEKFKISAKKLIEFALKKHKGGDTKTSLSLFIRLARLFSEKIKNKASFNKKIEYFLYLLEVFENISDFDEIYIIKQEVINALEITLDQKSDCSINSKSKHFTFFILINLQREIDRRMRDLESLAKENIDILRILLSLKLKIVSCMIEIETVSNHRKETSDFHILTQTKIKKYSDLNIYISSIVYFMRSTLVIKESTLIQEFEDFFTGKSKEVPTNNNNIGKLIKGMKPKALGIFLKSLFLVI